MATLAAVGWCCFSALQRAEIAEIPIRRMIGTLEGEVSVLFNEPKLLKSGAAAVGAAGRYSFSALQRAEIAEIRLVALERNIHLRFQCSSTSRNC